MRSIANVRKGILLLLLLAVICVLSSCSSTKELSLGVDKSYAFNFDAESSNVEKTDSLGLVKTIKAGFLFDKTYLYVEAGGSGTNTKGTYFFLPLVEVGYGYRFTFGKGDSYPSLALATGLHLGFTEYTNRLSKGFFMLNTDNYDYFSMYVAPIGPFVDLQVYLFPLKNGKKPIYLDLFLSASVGLRDDYYEEHAEDFKKTHKTDVSSVIVSARISAGIKFDK